MTDPTNNLNRSTVCVIIPTYNRAQYICSAIESVLSQSYKPLTIIVVDDGSTDNTAEVISRYTDIIKYFRIVHCGLASKVRNAGLEMVQEDYVAFLDSDDQWLPNKLEQQVRILDEHPEVGLICTNAFVLGEGQDKPNRLYLQGEQLSSGNVLQVLLRNNFVITSTVVIRRSLLEHVGTFSEDHLLRVGEDYDLWLRIAAVSQVFSLPDALCIYRDHAESIRSQQSIIDYWQGMLLILDRLRRQLKAQNFKDVDVVKLMNELSSTYHHRLWISYWAAGRFPRAATSLMQALRHHPINGFRLICYELYCLMRSTLKG